MKHIETKIENNYLFQKCGVCNGWQRLEVGDTVDIKLASKKFIEKHKKCARKK